MCVYKKVFLSFYALGPSHFKEKELIPSCPSDAASKRMIHHRATDKFVSLKHILVPRVRLTISVAAGAGTLSENDRGGVVMGLLVFLGQCNSKGRAAREGQRESESKGWV